MKFKTTNNFVSPNPEITAHYDDLIANNPDEFIRLMNEKRLKTTCLSPSQQKFVKKTLKKQHRKASLSAFKTLWIFLKNYKTTLVWLFLVTILAAILSCLAVFGLQQFVQIIPSIAYNQQNNLNILMYYGFILLLIHLLTSLMIWLQTWFMTIVAQKVGFKIREQLFSKIQKLPTKYFDQNSSGDLMSKFTNDVNNITNVLSQNIVIVLNGIFMILGMAISMFLMSPYLALITLALTPCMFLPMILIAKKAQPLFQKTQAAIGKLNGFIEEMISGQSVVNLYNQSNLVMQKFKQINNELQKNSRKSQAMTAVMFPIANCFTNTLMVIIALLGIIFFINDINFAGIQIPPPFGIIFPDTNPDWLPFIQASSTISTIASFSVMSRNFLLPFAQIANVSNVIQAGLAGANRAFSVFEEKDEINEFEHIILRIASNTATYKSKTDVKNVLNNILVNNVQHTTKKKDTKLDNIHLDTKMEVKPLKPFKTETAINSIKVQNLNFSYNPNKQILFDINIDAKVGQKIAIVGPTGSGKSTFINLLTKFYDITDGDILIGDKISIKEITKASMRKNISIVLQDTFLFNISIKDNLKCGKPEITDEEVIEAAKIANAHSFITQLPNGYDTVLEDNGESLSQGERQLLAITRAILERSDMLILDEATSSIDSKTEIVIQNAMNKLMENKTSFIIAHRLSTIENADLILVLKDGYIIERGTHKELLKQKGFYYSLHNSQFYEDL